MDFEERNPIKFLNFFLSNFKSESLIKILPSDGSNNPNNKSTKVVFPEPVAPIMPTT